ncbi:hypothetical protein [Pseudomonas sp. NA-150]|uniref:hypothetical protein n=1 Tax=Pseudomonas sp. NA-150 TaxID=3367525 RepID=UPI0037CAB2E5
MGTYTNPDGSKQLVSFEAQVWTVEAIDEVTHKLHLKNIRTDALRLASAAQVEPVEHDTLNQAVAAKSAEKSAKRALILCEGFTPEQKEQARHRFEIIDKQFAGQLTVDEAAKECGLSIQRYYEVRKLFSFEVGPISLLGKKRGRKKEPRHSPLRLKRSSAIKRGSFGVTVLRTGRFGRAFKQFALNWRSMTFLRTKLYAIA